MKKWVVLITLSCLPLLNVASSSVNRAVAQTQPAASGQNRPDSETVEEHIKRKQYKQALALLPTIANADNRDAAARSLAEAAWQSGRYDIALQSAQKITNLPFRVQTLQGLAQAHVAVGQQQQAATIVSQAFELSKKTNEFVPTSWVEHFLATGQNERAKAIINGIKGDDYNTAFARSLIAQAYLNLGRYTEAFEFAKRIPDRVLLPLAEYPDPKVELFEKIIQTSLQAGQYNFAKQVALTLNNKDNQVTALQTIARHYAKNGKTQQAAEVLNQSLTIAKTIESVTIIPERHYSWREPNANILLAIANDYVELGQKQRSLESLALATQSVRNFETQYAFDTPVWNKSKALRPLASSYVKLGEQSKAADLLMLAFQEAQTLKGNEHIIKELVEISTAYAELGNLKQGAQVLEKTRSLLETVEPPPQKIGYLLQMAKGFATVGKGEQATELLKTALPLIEAIGNPQGQLPMLMQSIGVYAAAGQNTPASQLLAKVLPTIQALEPTYERPRALNELAVMSAQAKSSSLALEVVKQISEPVDKTRMLFAIAEKYAEKGNTSLASQMVTQAFTAANTIRDTNQRNNFFAETSRTLGDLTDFYQNPATKTWRYNVATQIAKAISTPETKAEILLPLALKHLEAGEVKTSNQTLTSVVEVAKGIKQQPQWQTKLLETIESAMKLQKYDFVVQVVNAIKDADSKTVVLRRIAQNYANAGNKERATAVLSQARQVANTIEDESAKKIALTSITQQQQQWRI